MLIRHSTMELAGLIINYIHKREELHQCGMTVVGYAIEMILSQTDGNWDKVSAEFRKFLEQAHKDLTANINVN